MRSKVLIGIILLVSSCLSDEPVETIEGLLAKQVKEIDDYLAANPPSPAYTIVRDASGIRLVIIEQGTGAIPPNIGNNLKVGYTAKVLSTGAIVDSNDGFPLKLSDDIIDGWKIALGLMTQGTQATVYIPAVWAYGSDGKGNVPPNANMVFDMNLINVVPTQQQVDKLEADIAAIDAYLATNQIVAQTHESGIRYVITQEGTGQMPTLYDGVKVNFKAIGLSDGGVITIGEFEPSVGFSSRVVNYPHGAVVGLQLMAEGSKATFYVPSILVYGLNGAPAGANVIFEIELLEVVTQ